jgi:2-dehydro-3-deoxygluconokinase
MAEIVTFGEVMMRLTPRDSARIVQAVSFDAHPGGSEFNVAAGLSRLGHKSRFITRLPDSPTGKWAEGNILSHGVELTDDAYVSEGRLGIYYLEKGASPRPNRVVYDRSGSAISLAKASDFDWDKYLAGAGWFHVSGITPALSPELAAATVDAIDSATGNDIPVSFDINYRARLWSTADAREALEPLLSKVKVVFSTEEDLQRVFKIDASNPEECSKAGRELLGAEIIAVTLREMISVLRNRWGGCVCGPDGFARSAMYDVEVIDRVGAGDAFTAGFIAGMLDGDIEQALEQAAAFSALKQTIPGDVCTATADEVESLIKSGGAGRIQR